MLLFLTKRYTWCYNFWPAGTRGVTIIDQQVHGVLLFLSNRYTWYYYFWPTGTRDVTRFDQQTCEVRGQRMLALPSLDWLEIYSAKQTRNAEFTGRKSAIGRLPASKSHSVPSFRYEGSLVRRKSWNLETCDAHRSEVPAQLVPLCPACCWWCARCIFQLLREELSISSTAECFI